jgi:hypothetical protein
VGILFDDACAEIKAAGVVFDIPADLPALNRLSTLADRVEGRGFPDASAALLAPTVRVGNVTLHRLTIGAQQFVSECVVPWFGEERNASRLYLGIAWTMAHARDPDAIQEWHGDREGFARGLKVWSRGIGCRWIELVDAIARFRQMELEDESKGDGEDVSGWGPLIECLCREYGHDARHWLWVATIAEITTIIGSRQARAVIEAQSQGPIKGVAPDPDRPDLRALRELRAAVAAFKARGAK